MLNLLLRSKAETAVLGIVLFQEGLHLREIARQASISPFEARREVQILEKAGVLQTALRGNQRLVHLNPLCPFLSELKSLYLKTDGLFAQITAVLKPFSGLRFGLVYGSRARGEERPNSDLDLLLIGSADETELSPALFEFQRKAACEINYNLWSDKDFEHKALEDGAFIRSVKKEKKVFLLGDEREFIAACQKARNPARRSR